MEPGRDSCAHGSRDKRAESTQVFASGALVTVTLAANMRGGMWTQTVCEVKTDRVRPHGRLFPRQLVSHSPTHWVTQDALLDTIDAIDTDMHARPGDAELIPWLLVLDCAPQHVAKEFRSIMRDTQPHIKLCYVQRNCTAYTQPLDRAYMRAFKSSIRSEVAKHFADFFLEATDRRSQQRRRRYAHWCRGISGTSVYRCSKESCRESA